ncbi:MAG: META domain-containing protein [Rhodobacter sp.]|nr:META domain-containing protein [Rhodobacter sp.]
MRRFNPLAPALVLALFPSMAPAQTINGIDWQLLAIDGTATDTHATLRIEADGIITGDAPCNRWSTVNSATPPALQMRGIRATRMACDKLADERVFFEALSGMTALRPDGDSNLVLTGPDGRSMEFVRDIMSNPTTCKTCKADD